MQKLLIYPGDWHLLKNFQEVLMKQYFHSGLQEIALASGFKASTLRALQACSHIFLLNVWEAMYQQMLHKSSLLDSTIDVQSIPTNVDTYASHIESILKDSNCYINFQEYVRKQGEVDHTYKYWSDFVLVDCCAYIQLYLAIRSGNWSLRVAAIKQMAPLFTVFDQDIYMKLIPSHLLDIAQHYPSEILACFMSGGFTVSLNGEPLNNVALDEAHEKKINKDLKSAIVRPTADYLQKLSLFFNYRIIAYKNVVSQLLNATKHDKPNLNSSKDSRNTANIHAMYTYIDEHHMFSPQALNRGLVNVFTSQAATLH